MRVTGLDHVVLLVADAERSLAWYGEHLGLEPVRLDEWRRGEVPFVSVRVDEGTIVDLVEGERTGVNVDHLCLVLEGVDLDDLAASRRFEQLNPPTELFGARGLGRGMYVRDPDSNVVELRTYTDGS